MEIKIEVNEEQFKKVLDNALETLPPEKLQAVIFNGLKEYLTKSDVMRDLFITQEYYSSPKRPSAFLMNLVDKSIATDALNETRDRILKAFENNYKSIFEQALINTIFSGLFNNGSFISAAQMAASSIVHDSINNHVAKDH